MTSPTKNLKSKTSIFFQCNLEDLPRILRAWTTLWHRGSETGVHVPLVVHLPIWRGRFTVGNRRKNIFIIIHFALFIHICPNCFMLLLELDKGEYWVHTCLMYT